MFSYIIGEVKFIREDYIVLENNNIGYKIFMPARSISKFVLNETRKVFTEFVVREDSVTLYGFDEIEDLEMFLSLNNVSGIGPKAANSILSTLSVFELKLAIVNNDYKTITKAPGIGKKSASRIILELTDSIDIESLSGKEEHTQIVEKDENYKVAVEALINLGYNNIDAKKALKDIDTTDMKLSDIIKSALKRI
ncbi:Holliday junction branch migration protein RuvA [Helcococcus sueciensis]|uniref:Holliday junction branch migration protein RuvA n=1 Tax=Helcococcus sueciensis TaxID=241555 RepID=UPI00041460AD|nr:Holliday junction branch migration protein RuvA [Helcococcus sueciensis]